MLGFFLLVYIKAFLIQSISSLLEGFFLYLIYKHLTNFIKDVLYTLYCLISYCIGLHCMYIFFISNLI